MVGARKVPDEPDDNARVRLIGPDTSLAINARPFTPMMIRSVELNNDVPMVNRSIVRMVDFARRYAAARGLYRIFNTAQYRFYRSQSGPPQTSDTPFATSASLPNTPAVAFANGTWYLSVSYFNGVIDSGFFPIGPNGESYLTLEVAGGVAVGTRPGAPLGSSRLEMRPGGVVRVIGMYSTLAEGVNKATGWGIAYTINGSTPPTDAPTITPTMGSGALEILAYDLPSQANGTTVKVCLQTRRLTAPLTYLYSRPALILSIVVNSIGPSAPLALGSWSDALPEDL